MTKTLNQQIIDLCLDNSKSTDEQLVTKLKTLLGCNSKTLRINHASPTLPGAIGLTDDQFMALGAKIGITMTKPRTTQSEFLEQLLENHNELELALIAMAKTEELRLVRNILQLKHL